MPLPPCSQLSPLPSQPWQEPPRLLVPPPRISHLRRHQDPHGLQGRQKSSALPRVLRGCVSASSPPRGSAHTWVPHPHPQDTEQDHEPPYEISVQEEVTARLHFVKFENTYIEACLDFIKDHLVNTETKVIQATGGGAYKFKDLIEEKLQLK